MGFRLIPRFYYLFPLAGYLIQWRKRRNSHRLLNQFGIDQDQIFATNNGRTALRLLLSSVQTNGKPLRVGVQVFTCQTVFRAIAKAGAIPVFIDITREFTLDMDDLKKKSGLMDILIITHLFGIPEKFNEIRQIIKNKIIIEDCAHAFLTTSKGRYAGTLGQASVFSSGLAKFPSIGYGGWAIVNDFSAFPDIRQNFKKLSGQPYIEKYFQTVKIFLFSILLKPPFYGLITYKFGKRADQKLDLTGKWSFKEFKEDERLINQTGYFFDFCLQSLSRQKENIRQLLLLLNEKIDIAPIAKGSNGYVFALLIQNRDILIDNLLKINIEAGKHFSKCVEWALEFGYQPGSCPVTEKIVTEIVSIPVHRLITMKEIRNIARVIHEHVKRT